ncbi:MAG: HDIG domain-containing protein [Actinobacteria bacterium]|nr:HDIG domain-containing protein [Actinomycetota bacterium]
METGETPDAAAARAWAGYRPWTTWIPAITGASAMWALILIVAFFAYATQMRRRHRRRPRHLLPPGPEGVALGPHVGRLALEQDPMHHHKDVLAHTIAVVAKTRPERIVRLAALFHDIGKPKTRSFGPGGKVSFHHHEVVGARMTRERMQALRYSAADIDAVSRLVELHLRFHTYKMGWTDSAVRRYVRDAGPLLEELNELTRCDCTTRNRRRAEELARRMDTLEARIEALRAEEELGRMRPDLDGLQVMEHLGIAPGPVVGEALDFLLELRLEEGPLGEEEARRRLDGWWAARQRG